MYTTLLKRESSGGKRGEVTLNLPTDISLLPAVGLVVERLLWL
jgi:hypothetical protein